MSPFWKTSALLPRDYTFLGFSCSHKGHPYSVSCLLPLASDRSNRKHLKLCQQLLVSSSLTLCPTDQVFVFFHVTFFALYLILAFSLNIYSPGMRLTVCGLLQLFLSLGSATHDRMDPRGVLFKEGSKQ